ncbi:MAG: DNA-directed RNA polymerase subunit H [archaeon]
MKDEFDITKHILVPKHVLLSKKDTADLLDKYKITVNELPRISITDPAIKALKAELNDVIKITRKSPTSGETVFYRRVVK